MGRNKSIAPTVRAQAAALATTGLTQRQIGNRLGISAYSVNLTVKKSTTTGIITDSARSGRPRVTLRHDDRVLKRLVQRNPFETLPELSQDLLAAGVHASTSTLSRRLSRKLGLKSYKPAKKPKLTPKMAKARLAFAKRFAHYTTAYWDKVMWTDESVVEQFGSRVKHIRRPAKQRYNPRYVVQTMKHPAKQMIWGSMSSQGRGGLFFLPIGTTMNGKTYLNMLQEKLNIHMGIHRTPILMQDGAPCHRAKIVSEWLRMNSVEVLQ